MAEYQKMDVGFVRSVWVLAACFTGGVVIGVYVVLVFLMAPPDDFDINDFREY